MACPAVPIWAMAFGHWGLEIPDYCGDSGLILYIYIYNGISRIPAARASKPRLFTEHSYGKDGFITIQFHATDEWGTS